MNPILSIIIATINCPDKLKICLTSACSIFADLPKNRYEFLIQDGSEDDGIEKIVNQFREDLHIFYVRQPDNGIYDAWNHAIERASGTWAFFLGADDRFIPGFPIDQLVNELKIRTEPLVTIPVKYIFGNFWSITKTDTTNFSNKIRYSNPFHHQGTFQQTKLIQQVGFDTRFKIGGDFDVMLAITESKPDNIVCLEMPALVEMHSGGLSSRVNTNFVRLQERALVRKKNGVKTNYPIVATTYVTAIIKVVLAWIIGDIRLSNYIFQIKTLVLTKVRILKKNS